LNCFSGQKKRQREGRGKKHTWRIIHDAGRAAKGRSNNNREEEKERCLKDAIGEARKRIQSEAMPKKKPGGRTYDARADQRGEQPVGAEGRSRSHSAAQMIYEKKEGY